MWTVLTLIIIILLVAWMASKKEESKEQMTKPVYIKYGNDAITNEQLIRYAQQGN